MAKDKVKDVPVGKEAAQEATLTVDGKTYKISEMSAEARANLQSIQFADQEVNRLNMALAMAKTARNAYRKALMANLPEKK